MIDIIALLIATAVIDSPLSHTSVAATSSALKSTISAPAPMTPEQRLEKAKALYEKGFDYEYGITKTVDRTLADKFLKEAADLGHADALFFLGMNAVDRGDLEQARAYADSAIELGNMAGKYILAEISEQEYLGDSEELYKAGFKALKEKVEQGDLHYSNVLGYAYRFGIGTEENIKQAIKVFTPSAEQGNAMSLGHLGEIYFEQGKVEDAKKFTLKSAEKNNSKAQLNLGVMYVQGQGVRQDDKQAVHWYRKAAEQGVAEAQYNLGLMYAKGQGVRQDDTQVVQWYRKAAEQGLAEAQYNLGLMYYHGRGIRQNHNLAKEWFGKACQNGLQQGCEGYRHLDGTEF